MLAVTTTVGLPTGAAQAQSAGTSTLSGADIILALGQVDAAGTKVALDATALTTFLTASRCACPTSVTASLALDDAAASALGSDTLEATLEVGSDCDNTATATCKAVGSPITLSASRPSATQTLSTGDLFQAVQGGTGCASIPSTSTGLWAILRQDGSRLTVAPSLAIGVGGSSTAPANVTTQTADGSLVVSWTAAADISGLSGYQVLCSPGPANPPTAAYTICAAAPPAATTPDGSASPFGTFGASAVCSGLVSPTATSTRITGLRNGQSYQIAVVAISSDGTPSGPSSTAQGVPGPTVGFDDLYKQEGGAAAFGCAVAEGAAPATGAILIVGAAILWARRRRRRRPRRGRVPPGLAALSTFALAATLCHGREARALDFDPSLPLSMTGASTESPRDWNLELGFGPYRPDVDSEFSSAGNAARPFAETFGTGRRLMTEVELDRHLSHRGGTWAAGLGVGYYRVSAAALSADRLAPTGDTTALRLIPVSLSAVYRADLLAERTGLPLLPYAKAGLDCALWSISDSAKSSPSDGRTFGWHATIGLALRLDFIDPENARTLDQDAGINHTAIFIEGTRAALDGLGGNRALNVGDTTWMAGLMLEL